MELARRSRTPSHRTFAAPVAVALALAAAACGSDPAAPPDTGVTVDAGSPDAAALPDTGAGEDAAPQEDAAAPRDAGATDGDPAPADVGVPDLGVPDAGTPDTGSMDTGPVDTGPIVPPCPCSFVEDLTSAARIDAARTTAVIDTAGTGWARVPAPRSLEAVGLGAEGDFLADGTNTVTPGTHDFGAFTIDFGNFVEVAGDLVLSVAGDFTVSQEAFFHVTGDLTIIAGGAVTLDCASLEVGGDLVIHQPGTDGISVGCAGFSTTQLYTTNQTGAASSGRIELWTRGGLEIGSGGRIQTGTVRDPSAHVGAIEVRAYGDVVVGPSDAYLYTGDAWGANGDIAVFTEGGITVDGSSYVKAGQALGVNRSGGSVALHARGAIEVTGQSYVIASPGGSLELLSEAEVRLVDDGYLLTQSGGQAPTSLVVRGRAVELSGGGSASAGGYVLSGESQQGAGSVLVEARDAITLDGASTIGANDAHCLPGGSVSVKSGGTIEVAGSAVISGGDSVSGMNGCMPVAGGAVTAVARGAINAASTAFVAGAGASAGARTVTPNDGSYGFGLLDAALAAPLAAESIALQLEADVDRLVTLVQVIGAEPAGHSEIFVLVSPDGAGAFVPADQIPGGRLHPGWRYRLLVAPRMFDPAAADGFSLAYQ